MLFHQWRLPFSLAEFPLIKDDWPVRFSAAAAVRIDRKSIRHDTIKCQLRRKRALADGELIDVNWCRRQIRASDFRNAAVTSRLRKSKFSRKGASRQPGACRKASLCGGTAWVFPCRCFFGRPLFVSRATRLGNGQVSFFSGKLLTI